jgi:hypothetical protein
VELLIGAAGAVLLLLVLVLAVDRRQRRGAEAGSPHLPPSAGAPAHGSNSDGGRMLGGAG